MMLRLRLRDPRSIAPLIEALADEDEQVRQNAAAALSVIKAQSASPEQEQIEAALRAYRGG